MLDLRELYWAAGFIEGEGSVGHYDNGLSIQANQVQLEPLERLQRLFGGSIISVRPQTPKSQEAFRWAVYGRKAAGVIMTLWNLMSPRRQAQMSTSLATWKRQLRPGTHPNSRNGFKRKVP